MSNINIDLNCKYFTNIHIFKRSLLELVWLLVQIFKKRMKMYHMFNKLCFCIIYSFCWCTSIYRKMKIAILYYIFIFVAVEQCFCIIYSFCWCTSNKIIKIAILYDIFMFVVVALWLIMNDMFILSYKYTHC